MGQQIPLVPRFGGSASSLNINTSATVVKALPGTLWTVSVTTAGSAPGSVHDVATTGAAAAANLVYDIPNTVGVYSLYWPCKVGIVVTPGTGQVLSVAYA
jgi:hypothetical protein